MESATLGKTNHFVNMFPDSLGTSLGCGDLAMPENFCNQATDECFALVGWSVECDFSIAVSHGKPFATVLSAFQYIASQFCEKGKKMSGKKGENWGHHHQCAEKKSTLP